ncbi:MAG: HD domain-containing protein [Thermomicrobiales bacterium]
MDRNSLDLLTRIESHAREQCRNHDRAHDASHLMRVEANARKLLERECATAGDIDEFVVLAACWLHDVVQYPKGSAGPGESARESARRAREYLTSLGVGESRSNHVAAAVRTHSFSGGEKPESMEAAIVQDADRLDALGAIGIARLWIVAAELGSDFYHPDDPMAENRPLEDARYALDHFASKLLKLPDLMNHPFGTRSRQGPRRLPDRVPQPASQRDLVQGAIARQIRAP